MLVESKYRNESLKSGLGSERMTRRASGERDMYSCDRQRFEMSGRLRVLLDVL
jgi:hypothetical protein